MAFPSLDSSLSVAVEQLMFVEVEVSTAPEVMAIGDELEIECPPSEGALSGETAAMVAHLFAFLSADVGVDLGDFCLLAFCLKSQKIMSIKFVLRTVSVNCNANFFF